MRRYRAIVRGAPRQAAPLAPVRVDAASAVPVVSPAAATATGMVMIVRREIMIAFRSGRSADADMPKVRDDTHETEIVATSSHRERCRRSQIAGTLD
jgi:hypothetical protein